MVRSIVIIRGLLFGLTVVYSQGQEFQFRTQARPHSSEVQVTARDCVEGGPVAVMFSNLLISRYVAWFAAALLLIGIIQILVGLFVFLSDALDIYMLLLNYCLATIFCILTVMISGGGAFLPLKDTCKYLSPLNCVAISVPMMTLFLLSYSRFYAITYPFYYVDRFTILNQVIACALSWLIPIVVVTLGSLFLCTSISATAHTVFVGFCVFPSQDLTIASYKSYNEKGEYIYMDGDYPASSGCQTFMMGYVLICLILPLCGCIVCYSSIVYQLTVIKKNREKMTNSSAAGPVPQNPADQLVPMVEQPVEKKVPAAPIKSKTLSVKSIRQHLKKQTSVISQKAKEKIPVSVILILTLYIFVAVPFTLVLTFNNFLISSNSESMFWINLNEKQFHYEKNDYNQVTWCDNKGLSTKQEIKSTMIDISFSLGLLALALTPWAYIKFTKSFEENLWLRPLKKISSKIGLEISKSVRNKYTAADRAKYTNQNYNSGTTSGYSTAAPSRLSSSVPTTNSRLSTGQSSQVYGPSQLMPKSPNPVRAGGPRPVSPRPPDNQRVQPGSMPRFPRVGNRPPPSPGATNRNP